MRAAFTKGAVIIGDSTSVMEGWSPQFEQKSFNMYGVFDLESQEPYEST